MTSGDAPFSKKVLGTFLGAAIKLFYDGRRRRLNFLQNLLATTALNADSADRVIDT